MGLYNDLAQAYDELFPLSQASVDYLLGILPPGLPVMDLGCATASLLVELGRRGIPSTGLEPSPAMVEEAQAALARAGLPSASAPKIVAADLSQAGLYGKPASLGLVLCLGNTLPHLESEKAVGDFFQEAYGLLAPGGSLVIQTLNYDRVLGILEAGPYEFPSLEAKGLRFFRRYEPGTPGPGAQASCKTLAFLTRLVSPEGQVHEDSLSLHPYSPSFLVASLVAAGFQAPQALASWRAEAFDSLKDPYLILRAVKAG